MESTIFTSTLSLVLTINNLEHCARLWLWSREGHILPLHQLSGMSAYRGNYIFSGDHAKVNVTRADEAEMNSEGIKFSRRCVFVVIQEEKRNLTSLNNSLQIFRGQLHRPEQDYYVFCGDRAVVKSDDYLQRAFRMGKTFKNNLFIGSNSNNELLYYTGCPFCESGTPSVLLLTLPTFPDLLNNFHYRQLRISCPTSTTSVFEVSQITPDKWSSKRGYFHHAFLHLMHKYNFSASYFPSSGGGGTGQQEKGEWRGTVGDVLSGRTDMGQITAQIYDRYRIVSFSTPVGYEWLTFTTGEGQRRYTWRSVYRPLSSQSWALLVGSVVMSVFSLTLLHCDRHPKRLITSVGGYLVCSLLEQSKRPPKNSPAVRVFTAAWLVFAFLITNTYRSKLVSFLAFPAIDEPPKTFPELAGSPNYRVTLHYIRGAAYELLRASRSATFQTIVGRMKLEEDPVKCFTDVMGEDGQFQSCIAWYSFTQYVYHRSLSDKRGRVPLVASQDTSSFVAIAFIFKKGAIFQQKFNGVIARAVDMGLVEKWKQVDYHLLRSERRTLQKNACSKNRPVNLTPAATVSVTDRSRENGSLKLKNLMAPIYICVAGCVTGMLSFLAEWLLFGVYEKNPHFNNFYKF